MFYAAGWGEAQVVAAWLDEGGSVDARCAEFCSSTLLMATATREQEAIVRMLLQRGASVNLQNSLGIAGSLPVELRRSRKIVETQLAVSLVQEPPRTSIARS